MEINVSKDIETTVAVSADDEKHEDEILARQAVDDETHMSLGTGLSLYPMAVFWAIVMGSTVIMEGFDTSLMGNFFALPSFQKKYGRPDGQGGFQLTAAWQSGLTNGATVGEIFGLFLNGWASERFGFRITMMLSLLSCVAFIFIAVFAKNLATLEVYEILMGIPWGIFQTNSTTYASEICPVVLRAYLPTWVNMSWHLGALISTGILRGFLNRTDQWSYRIPFMLQWVWPIPLMVAAYFAPESPLWLVRVGRTEDAVRAVKRLASRKGEDSDIEARKTVAMMVKTHELELETTAGVTFLDCFRGVDGRRTEIACLAYCCQNICTALSGSYFFTQAGLPTTQSFDLAMGQYTLEIVGTILAWPMMRFFGRRTLYLYGMACIFVFNMAMGFCGLAPNNKGADWAVGSLVLVNFLVYSATVGSVAYCLVPEISSNRLRAKTVSLARAFYNVVGLISGIIVPHMINKTGWNQGAKTAFLYACIQFLSIIWMYFRLPEPRGRTFAELDVLFSKGVPARKFSTTVVDPFDLRQEAYEKAE